MGWLSHSFSIQFFTAYCVTDTRKTDLPPAMPVGHFCGIPASPSPTPPRVWCPVWGCGTGFGFWRLPRGSSLALKHSMSSPSTTRFPGQQGVRRARSGIWTSCSHSLPLTLFVGGLRDLIWAQNLLQDTQTTQTQVTEGLSLPSRGNRKPAKTFKTGNVNLD